MSGKGDHSGFAIFIFGIFVGVILMLGALIVPSQSVDRTLDATMSQEATKPKGEKDRTDETLWQKTFDDPVAFYTLVLTMFTGVLSFASIAQIKMLIRTDESTRIAANAARDSADSTIAIANSDRAWLIFDRFVMIDIKHSMVDKEYIGDGIGVVPRWVNSGRTPAINATIQTQITVVDIPIEDDTTPIFANSIPDNVLGTATIGPQGGSQGGYGEGPMRVVFDIDTTSILEHKKAIIAYTCVRYFSIMNNTPRTSEACCVISLPGMATDISGRQFKNWQIRAFGRQNVLT